MSLNFLRIPTADLASLRRLGVEQFPDVTDWSQNTPRPLTVAEHPQALTNDADVSKNVDGVGSKGRGPEDEHSSEKFETPRRNKTLRSCFAFMVNFCF